MQARIRKKGKVLPRQRSFAMALVRDNGPNRIYGMTEWIESILKRIYIYRKRLKKILTFQSHDDYYAPF